MAALGRTVGAAAMLPIQSGISGRSREVSWVSFNAPAVPRGGHFPVMPFFCRESAFYNTGVPIRFTFALMASLMTLGGAGRAVAQSQAAMTQSACNKMKRAENALTGIYEQIVKAKATDGNFVTAFREAHAAWIAFRDAHLRAIFPDPDPNTYGSANSMCRCGIQEQMTIQRTRELRRLWITGIDEGDVCAGSCAVKSASSVPTRKE